MAFITSFTTYPETICNSEIVIIKLIHVRLYDIFVRYSHLFNKREGWNKRGGGAKVAKSLNVEAGINVEVGKYL